MPTSTPLSTPKPGDIPASESERHVAEQVAGTLNDLIETCHDGDDGFRACAEHATSPELRTLFLRRAETCRHSAQELRAHVAALGASPQDHGTARGALHRGWVAVRGTLAGASDLAMLEECERGEDAALARYRAALKLQLPPAVRALVERQYDGVKSNHDQIRNLRDRMKATH